MCLLTKAEQLIGPIKAKGAKLTILGTVYLSELAINKDGVARIVLESVQDMLLKVALQTARDDYEIRREWQRQGVGLAKASGKYKGRKPDNKIYERIIALRESGMTIDRTAILAGCSIIQVKRIWSI